MKKIAAVTLLAVIHCTAGADPKWVESQDEIEKIISGIPVTDKDFGYRHIGERMKNIGMKISSVRVDRVGKEDAEPPTYIAGDQIIDIRTNRPNDVVKALCPILGNPSYVKRGKKYIPQNRTAYWLMTNRCDFK